MGSRRSAGGSSSGLGTGILLSAGKGLAEGLASEIIGVGGCALGFPFVTFEGWEGLGVVGDVGGGARQACAVVDESVRIASICRSRAVLARLWASVLLSTTPSQPCVGVDGRRRDIAAAGEVCLSRDQTGEGGEGHDER